MTWGLGPNGFVMPNYNDLVSEIEALYRAQFGNGINLRADEFLGQVIRIHAGREITFWQQMLAVYNAYYPETAQGMQLDNVSSITAVMRLPATYSQVTGTASGVLGTIIPAGAIVSVQGNATLKFKSKNPATIGAGTNEVQKINFNLVPDAGQWTIGWNGQTTGVLAFNANAAAVQAALNALMGLSVTVAGNYAAGFTVTFVGASGSQPQPMMSIASNTLKNAGNAVTVFVTEPTPGLLPNVSIDMVAVNAGPVAANSHSLTVIETIVAGWNFFDNLIDADQGKPVESDSDFRLRRKVTLANGGSTTIYAILTRILEIAAVKAARVYENHTDVVDGAGRPPHSFEAVVLDGANADIGNVILNEKPAGIQTFGNTAVVVVDPQGFNQTVNFSRPTPVNIYIIVTIKVGASYPVGPAYTGTFAIAAGTKNMVGTGTKFLTELSSGDHFKISEGANSEYMIVDTIANDTHMTVIANAAHNYVAAAAYPATGDDAIKTAILAFAAANFSIGDNILPDLLYVPVAGIQDVQAIEIDAGVAPNPVGDAIIAITPTQIGVFDSGRISIVHA